MSIQDKSDKLAEKMNNITAKFSDNLESADELVLTGDDVLASVEEKTQDIKLYSEDNDVSEIINLRNMVSDFKFVRETLKENTTNARRVLSAVTLDLLDSDDDKRASLIMSFAELNKAVADNMKLYIVSYKEISKTLLNLDKLRSEQSPKDIGSGPGDKVINPTDLIKEFAESE